MLLVFRYRHQKMKTIIKINNIAFYGDYNNINSILFQELKIDNDDIVWGIDNCINQDKIQYYLEIENNQCQQQSKILKLFDVGIRSIPTNILIPFLYKKFLYIDKLKKYLDNKSIKNILILNQAQKICNNFPIILNNKIKYDFFKSATGRVSTNTGIIKKQSRSTIQHQYQLIQVDFSSFQPYLYQDYFLKSPTIDRDPYQSQVGQTRQQKKVNWYKKMFNNKQKVSYTNVFDKYKKQTIVYHLQCLQTYCMSRLIIQLNNLSSKYGFKMLMFLFDGIIFDSKMQIIQGALKQINWNDIFPKSKIIKYPFKLSIINN